MGLRLPILLFRAGVGPLFGRRLLLLHHVGRLTDLDRRVVLEVVAHDPVNESWIVASGFGARADWYQNLRHQPKTVIQIGNRPHAVTALFLSPDDGADIMAGISSGPTASWPYARRHPRTAGRLCTFMGLPADGSEASFREAGRSIPFVRLDGTHGHHGHGPGRA